MNERSYSRKMPLSQFDLWRDKVTLSSVDFELTERCNNNCSHCYINLAAEDREARRRELDLATISHLLEEAACLGCEQVRFTGGEPLLRDDFVDIYLYAKKLRFKTQIFTNGILISRNLAKAFHETPPGDIIQISLYGYDSKSYETITRVPGSFRAAMAGIDLLSEYGIPFSINPVTLPLTKDNLQAFEVWKASNSTLNVVQPLVTTLHHRCRGADLEHSRRIQRFRISAATQLELEARTGREKYILEQKRFCASYCAVRGDRLFRCGAGIKRGCVDAYGKFQMCLLLRHPDTVYDLTNGTMTDALRNFFPKIRERKANHPLFLERCSRCFLNDLCEQCPAVSWMEFRILDGWLEYFCEYTHALGRMIGLLRDGEKSWQVEDWQGRIKTISDAMPAHKDSFKTKAA